MPNMWTKLKRYLTQANSTNDNTVTANVGPVSNLAVRFARGVAKGLVSLVIICSALWAGLVLWVHLNDFEMARKIAAALLTIVVLISLVKYSVKANNWKKWLVGYGLVVLGVGTWFTSMAPKQDRAWKAEVDHSVSFTKDELNPNLVTVHNVRDFVWQRPDGVKPLQQPKSPSFHTVGEDGESEVADERWVQRRIDLDQLTGVDIINSYWMGRPIGHTLLSFRFKDSRPLSFSFEIRKEQDELFSAIGGFVRQFEIALIAAEERDIIYTRSNVRGEQVYLFPIEGLSNAQMKHLFRHYMQFSSKLQKQPKWYNTLLFNCTTIIFDFANQISGGQLPMDYRIIASGYVPEYLYDKGFLARTISDPMTLDKNGAKPDAMKGEDGHRLTIDQWYQISHINQKTAGFSNLENQQGYDYSKIIRMGLPSTGLK